MTSIVYKTLFFFRDNLSPFSENLTNTYEELYLIVVNRNFSAIFWGSIFEINKIYCTSCFLLALAVRKNSAQILRVCLGRCTSRFARPLLTGEAVPQLYPKRK